jgi:hypothetical protein
LHCTANNNCHKNKIDENYFFLSVYPYNYLFNSSPFFELVHGQNVDFSKMTQKEREAYMEKIRKESAEDHQQMLRLLNIDSLRPGVNGSDPNAPNAANYDESKANPYPDLPDPLLLKNGSKVTTAKMWWEKRRPEIVEDFDREIYGRLPQNLPKVNWEVVSTVNEMNADIPVVTKKLIGHVDNSTYPAVSVNIDLTLTTPANVKSPVPVIMELAFVFPPGFRFPQKIHLQSLNQPGNNRFWPKDGDTLFLSQPVYRQTTEPD